MNPRFRQVQKSGRDYHRLYCSVECAEADQSSEAAIQPHFSANGSIMSPDYPGHLCHTCGKRLVGPAVPPAAASKIPIENVSRPRPSSGPTRPPTGGGKVTDAKRSTTRSGAKTGSGARPRSGRQAGTAAKVAQPKSDAPTGRPEPAS